MRRFVLRAAAVALALLLLAPGAARADWVSGSATLNNGAPSTNGIVNFAVFSTTNPGSFASLGAELSSMGITGLSNFGVPANLSGPATSFLYFYQVANNQTSNATLTELQLSVPPSEIVAAGSATNQVAFHNNNGQTVGVNPNTLGSSGGTAIDQATPFVAAAPSASWGFSVNDPPGVSFQGGGIFSGQYTNIMVLASNVAPHNAPAYLVDGGAQPFSNAEIPMPAPEPGTFALIGLGLPLLGWGYVRRLRANRALAAVAQ